MHHTEVDVTSFPGELDVMTPRFCLQVLSETNLEEATFCHRSDCSPPPQVAV